VFAFEAGTATGIHWGLRSYVCEDSKEKRGGRELRMVGLYRRGGGASVRTVGGDSNLPPPVTGRVDEQREDCVELRKKEGVINGRK
jgi:hypothetical protein